MTILIKRNKDPFGWMGNMSRFPVVFKGKEFRTTEALFQSMRFDDEEIIEAIRAEKSPMTAKMVAKKNKDKMVIEPCGKQDVANMLICLRLKLEQHPELKQQLLDTGGDDICEDCSNRKGGSGLFWGAALDSENEWTHGRNTLGMLWMLLRTEIRKQQNEQSKS